MLKIIESKIKEIGNEFPSIRFGGCGVFAELLFDKLTAIDIVPKVIIFGWTKPIEVEELNKKQPCASKLLKEFHFFHIALKVNKVFIDSDGIHKSFEEIRKKNKLPFVSQREIRYKTLRFLNKQGIWNDKFDRKSIPYIRERFDKIFY